MPRCYPNIYRCIQCLPWHCQLILILWHFDCMLDFFNFSLRGTKIHPKKPAFLRPIKSFIFLKYMPRLHLLPSRISKFSGPPPPKQEGENPLLMPTALGDMPQACPVSAYFQKLSIYLKTFWEHWYLQSKCYSNIKFLFKSVGNMPMYELKVQKKSHLHFILCPCMEIEERKVVKMSVNVVKIP